MTAPLACPDGRSSDSRLTRPLSRLAPPRHSPPVPPTALEAVQQGRRDRHGGRVECGLAVLDVPERVLEQSPEGPAGRPCAVEVEDRGEEVEAAPDDPQRVALHDQLVPPAVQGRPQVEPGVAGQRFGVDGEPWLTLGGEDVVVVQVPVQHPVAGLADQLGHGRRPVEQEPTVRGVGEGPDGPGDLFEHLRGDVAEAPQSGWRRYADQPGLEFGEDAHRDVVVLDRRQRAGGVQALQEHARALRIMVEQPHRAPAVPGAQPDERRGGLLPRQLELQHRSRAVPAQHRQHQRGLPGAGCAVASQVPAVQDVRGEGRQPGDPGPPLVAEGPGVRRSQGVRNLDRF